MNVTTTSPSYLLSVIVGRAVSNPSLLTLATKMRVLPKQASS